jgi:hypothetical protein
VFKSLGRVRRGPVGLVHTQNPGIKSEKPLKAKVNIGSRAVVVSLSSRVTRRPPRGNGYRIFERSFQPRLVTSAPSRQFRIKVGPDIGASGTARLADE